MMLWVTVWIIPWLKNTVGPSCIILLVGNLDCGSGRDYILTVGKLTPKAGVRRKGIFTGSTMTRDQQNSLVSTGQCVPVPEVRWSLCNDAHMQEPIRSLGIMNTGPYVTMITCRNQSDLLGSWTLGPEILMCHTAGNMTSSQCSEKICVQPREPWICVTTVTLAGYLWLLVSVQSFSDLNPFFSLIAFKASNRTTSRT